MGQPGQIGMPRRERLDFKDAIHDVHVYGRAGPGIFFDAAY